MIILLVPREWNTIQDLPRSFTRRIFFVPTWRKTPTIKQRWCFSFRPAHGGDHWVVGYVTPWPRIKLALNLRCRKCRGPGLLRFYDHWCYHGHSFPLVFISWVVVIFHLHCSSPRVVSLCCQGCMCRSQVVFPVLVWRSFVSCGVLLCFPWLVSRFCSAVWPDVSTLSCVSSQSPRWLPCFCIWVLTEKQLVFLNIFQYFKCESLSNMIMKMRL